MSHECVCACTEWRPQESPGSSAGGGRRYNNKQRFIKSLKSDEQEEKDLAIQSPIGSSTSPTHNRAGAAKARGSRTPLAAANDSNNRGSGLDQQGGGAAAGGGGADVSGNSSGSPNGNSAGAQGGKQVNNSNTAVKDSNNAAVKNNNAVVKKNNAAVKNSNVSNAADDAHDHNRPILRHTGRYFGFYDQVVRSDQEYTWQGKVDGTAGQRPRKKSGDPSDKASPSSRKEGVPRLPDAGAEYIVGSPKHMSPTISPMSKVRKSRTTVGSDEVSAVRKWCEDEVSEFVGEQGWSKDAGAGKNGAQSKGGAKTGGAPSRGGAKSSGAAQSKGGAKKGGALSKGGAKTGGAPSKGGAKTGGAQSGRDRPEEASSDAETWHRSGQDINGWSMEPGKRHVGPVSPWWVLHPSTRPMTDTPPENTPMPLHALKSLQNSSANKEWSEHDRTMAGSTIVVLNAQKKALANSHV